MNFEDLLNRIRDARNEFDPVPDRKVYLQVERFSGERHITEIEVEPATCGLYWTVYLKVRKY